MQRSANQHPCCGGQSVLFLLGGGFRDGVPTPSARVWINDDRLAGFLPFLVSSSQPSHFIYLRQEPILARTLLRPIPRHGPAFSLCTLIAHHDSGSVYIYTHSNTPRILFIQSKFEGKSVPVTSGIHIVMYIRFAPIGPPTDALRRIWALSFLNLVILAAELHSFRS